MTDIEEKIIDGILKLAESQAKQGRDLKLGPATIKTTTIFFPKKGIGLRQHILNLWTYHAGRIREEIGDREFTKLRDELMNGTYKRKRTSQRREADLSDRPKEI